MLVKHLRLGAVGCKLGNASKLGLHVVNLYLCNTRAENLFIANGPVNVFITFNGPHLDTHFLLRVLCCA